MVGTLGFKHKDAMKDLLYLDTLRGRDSTGLAVVDRNRQSIIRKSTVPGHEFIEIPGNFERITSSGDQLWIGHNRYKTVGGINRASAHPFEVCNDEGKVEIIGAHNGTLDNKWELEKELGDRYETDSEALMNLLYEANDVKEAISMCRGAWSLTWWNAPNNQLHFLRNDQRPLCYAYTKDRKVLIWASEAWMLLAATRRHNIELDENAKGVACWSTLPNSLYTLDIPQQRDEKLPDLVRKGGYDGGKPAQFQGHKRWDWFGVQGDDSKRYERMEQQKAEEEKKAAKKTGEDVSKDDGKVVHLFGPDKMQGFNGKPIDKDYVEILKTRGCSWCNKEIKPPVNFGFLSENELVCGRCVYDKHHLDTTTNNIVEEVMKKLG